MKWILSILFSAWLCGFSQNGLAGYNLPHVKQFDLVELHRLSTALEPGLNYRLYGGEESYEYSYPEDAPFIESVIYFLNEVEGTATVVVPRSYLEKGTLYVIKALEASGIPVKYIEYENEEFATVEPRNWFEAIIWPIISRSRYEAAATQHITEFEYLIRYLENNGVSTAGRMVFNVPLKNTENGNFRDYTNVIAKSGMVEIVDVHVYVNQRQNDYFARLNRNLHWLRGVYDWEIVCFEYYGLWHFGAQRLDLNLKNTDRHRELHYSGLASLKTYGVSEVLLFTLASNTHTANWENSPVFNAFMVKPGKVINELDNVLE